MIIIDDFDTDDFELETFTESDESKEKLKEEWEHDVFNFDRFKGEMVGETFKDQTDDIIVID